MKSLLTVLTAVFALSLTAGAVEVPINEQCPVCKKDARLIFYSKTRDGRVAFASKECKATFDRTPGKYKVVKKQ